MYAASDPAQIQVRLCRTLSRGFLFPASQGAVSWNFHRFGQANHQETGDAHTRDYEAGIFCRLWANLNSSHSNGNQYRLL